jgi:hypothetical protein
MFRKLTSYLKKEVKLSPAQTFVVYIFGIVPTVGIEPNVLYILDCVSTRMPVLCQTSCEKCPRNWTISNNI